MRSRKKKSKKRRLKESQTKMGNLNLVKCKIRKLQNRLQPPISRNGYLTKTCFILSPRSRLLKNGRASISKTWKARISDPNGITLFPKTSKTSCFPLQKVLLIF